jgi:hypothetical protein
MKTDQAREIIIETLKTKTTVSAQEINYASKGTLPFIQIYTIMSVLINNGSVILNNRDGKKTYTLIDAEKLNDEVPKNVKSKPEKEKAVKEIEEDEPKEKPKKKVGRDLTTYKFNGNDYNKTRLAHAIVSQYVKDKQPSLKGLLEIFPDEIVKPYGMIRPIKEAKEISKDRLRFLIKPEEEIKVRDCVIACSNQWTPDRTEALLVIAKKLGYKVK